MLVILFSGPVSLWQFVLRLLLNRNYDRIIAWTGHGWEFRLRRPRQVATLWGQSKNNPDMNYSKLARGLRYYYVSNRLQKSSNTRHAYIFVDLSGPHQLGHTIQSMRDYYQLTFHS